MKNPLHYIHKYPQHGSVWGGVLRTQNFRSKQILGIDRQQFLELVQQAPIKA